MTSRNLNIFFWAFLMLFFSVSLVGCKDPKLKSTWRDREICVDGSSSEWQGCDQYYDEDSRTLVGVLNDENYLYLLLSTHDRERKRQIVGSGLTVWFDPKGGTAKGFGVRFPVGIPRHRRSMGPFPGDDGSDFSKRNFDDPKMELQLLGPEQYEQKTMLLENVEKYGIEIKVGEVEGNLIYKLKVPLTQRGKIRYAVRTGLAKSVGVGFETGKMVPEEMVGSSGKKGGDGGGRGGGPGKMGRRSPGGMGGEDSQNKMSGRKREKPPEPFELWTRVVLASKPDSLAASAVEKERSFLAQKN